MLYNNYKLPERKTKYSAGYDFLAIDDYVNTKKTSWTGNPNKEKEEE